MAIDGSMRRRYGGAEPASAPPGAVGDLSGWISSLCEGRGGVLLVEGVSAAGKSRIARQARTSARALPIRVLSGSGERDRQHLPFDEVDEDGAAWRTVPSWFVFGERDLNIPAAALRFMAERASARGIREIAGASHAIAASQPDAVAASILHAAGQRQS